MSQIELGRTTTQPIVVGTLVRVTNIHHSLYGMTGVVTYLWGPGNVNVNLTAWGYDMKFGAYEVTPVRQPQVPS